MKVSSNAGRERLPWQSLDILNENLIHPGTVSKGEKRENGVSIKASSARMNVRKFIKSFASYGNHPCLAS